MANSNLFLCVESSDTMDGLAMQELNRGVVAFLERLALHPGTGVTVEAHQFWDSTCARVQVDIKQLCHSARARVEDERKIFEAKKATGLPDFYGATKQVFAAAQSNGCFVFVSHNRSLTPLNQAGAAQNSTWPPAVADGNQYIVVGVDETELFETQNGRLSGHAIPQPSRGTWIVLRGVMFVEFFHWLADQFVQSNGAALTLNYGSLGDAVRELHTKP